MRSEHHVDVPERRTGTEVLRIGERALEPTVSRIHGDPQIGLDLLSFPGYDSGAPTRPNRGNDTTMLHTGRLFDGRHILRDCRVEIVDGRIGAVLPGVAPEPDDEVLATGLLVPGFIDLQINGYAGVDFARATCDDFARVLTALAATGTTSCLPTIITAPVDDLIDSLDVIEQAGHGPGARILGAHVEGPFLSERRRGAHRADLVRSPEPSDVARIAAHPATVLMTLAPELAGGMAAVAQIVDAKVVASIGHSDATAAEVHAAADHGARMVTHLFNAQRPIGHREPGVPGAALVDDRLRLGLIVDFEHVAVDMVRLTFAAAADRVVLVTDALASTGMPAGSYELGGDVIVVGAEGEPPRRLDGTLSGSGLTLATAVRNCVSAGVPLEVALRSATVAPAAVLGRSDVGTVTPGAWADLVWLDDDLDVRRVWLGGDPLR